MCPCDYVRVCTQVLVAEAWVPSGARPHVSEVLRRAAQQSSDSGVSECVCVCVCVCICVYVHV